MVIDTITQAKSPLNEAAICFEVALTVAWCSSQGKDSLRCGTVSVLSYLQEGLERHLHGCMQISLANSHWPFLNASEVIGAPRSDP